MNIATKPKKEKKPKVDHAWVADFSQWGVEKYGVALEVNPSAIPFFDKGCSLDVEDDELGNFVGIGIYSVETNTCYYWTVLDQALAVELSPFIAHNGVSDISKLQKWGFKVDSSFLLHDTQLMAHILDSSKKKYGLKALVSDIGIVYPSYEDLTGKKGTKSHTTLDKLPLELVANYNAMDCYATYKLYEQQIKGQGNILGPSLETPAVQYFNEIEKPCSFVFHKMETLGISVDLPYLSKLKETLEAQKLPLENEIKNELGDINLNSPKQLLEALNAKGISPQFKGKASTDKRALSLLNNVPIVKSLLAYSEVETLLSSFVYSYLERGEEVVHPQFRQTGTRTGRPSCSNPNLLQIPRRSENGKLVRRMFKARDGHLFGDGDFGQIEPRVLAHLSQDKVLCDMFNGGEHFHEFTQKRMDFGGVLGDGPEYERAKILNLSVGYRATYKSVSQQLKCSWNDAQKEIDKWWSMFPELYDWQQRLIYDAKRTGYCTTLFGRRIKVNDLDHNNAWRRESSERQLINNITQGSAAEIMKKAMLSVDKRNIDILVQVYDELLFESPEEAISGDLETVVECMATAVKLDVPLTVDVGIGATWTEAHS